MVRESGTLEERFWRRVDRRGPDECWEWKGSRSPKGYGSFSLRNADRQRFQGRTNFPAHRLALLLTIGDPGDRLACHTCDNPPCCNPAHLYAGTASDNMLDMHNRRRSWQSQRTHCPYGHPYDEQNTYVTYLNRRQCKTCLQARKRRDREKNRPTLREGRVGDKRVRVRSATWVPMSERTTCPQGHPYDDENTYVDTDGRRRCLTCRRARRRAKKERTGVWA